MSVEAQHRLITAEEFELLLSPEDGSLQELVKGVVIATPTPEFLHGHTCSIFAGRLYEYIHTWNIGFLAINNSGVILERDPDTVLAPMWRTGVASECRNHTGKRVGRMFHRILSWKCYLPAMSS